MRWAIELKRSSSDEEEEDTRIPKEVRDAEKRHILEANGGKKPEPEFKHKSRSEEGPEGDGMSAK